MRFLIYATIAFLALRALRPALLWLRLRHARIRPVLRVEIADASTYPPELEPVFEEAARQLAVPGFAPSHAQWTEAVVVAEGRRPTRVFLHAESATYAEVTPAIFENGRRVFDVAFTTHFASGHAITTVDALLHRTPLLPPDRMLRDDGLNDVAAQWRAHCEAVCVRAASDEIAALAPAAFIERTVRSHAAAVERGRQDGVLDPPAHGTFRLTRAAAWRCAVGMLAGTAEIARRERLRAAPRADGSEEAWRAAEEYAFRHAERQRTLPLDTRGRIWLFVASAVVSAVALGTIVSWALVPAVLFVLLLHEAGHIAGMWLFGYRDRQVVFVPFLGAAAFGRKHDATPFERLVVLLLGPVPGILFGFVCLRIAGATGAGWLEQLGLTALVLNYVNLLPFTPLDGGRIVEVLLLHRFPRAGVGFLLCSAAAAGIAGAATADPVLIVLSLALVAALPGQWIVARATADTRRLLPGFASRGDRIRAAFRALDARPKPVAPTARIPFARAIVEQLDAPYAPVPLALGGAALYGLLLVAPVVVTAMTLMPKPAVADLCAIADGRAPADLAPQYGRALTEVCADPAFPSLRGEQQWKTLVDRAGTHLARGDSALATQYYRLAGNAAVLTFDDDDPRRVATRSLVQELVAAEEARIAAAVARSLEAVEPQ